MDTQLARLVAYASQALIAFVSIASLGLAFWYLERRRDRRYQSESQHRQASHEARMFELEERKLQADVEKMHIEMKRHDVELQHEYERINNESKRLEEQSAGMGSGGYIIIDMPDQDRPFFHDLLKGFEDYAKLKGYSIAFSIDATYDGKMALSLRRKTMALWLGRKELGVISRNMSRTSATAILTTSIKCLSSSTLMNTIILLLN